ncbi:DUF4292 domain-containing protein [Fodinibius sediminis]|uniref:DUF4292 domain-containing protein n=1 Tax=Fodinibius sediminis TaxID=1214077 RepID=A0A521AB43_9BACT|nr:DUF4292 domain-containing protein [Fodinibius sediminis]SMO32043.1 hypothetical protein SAMN06265218_10120 [Fodinibius sediminis]
MTNSARILRPPRFLVILSGIIMVSCTGSRELSRDGYSPSETDVQAIVRQLPDYTSRLQTLTGQGRAIVSEPNNTERLKLLFSSSRDRSLVTIRNGLGIEGGELLTDGDTLLVYNKIDKYARKIPIREGSLDRINKLASLNILDIINFSVAAGSIQKMHENKTHYQLFLNDGVRVFVDKKSLLVREVVQPPDTQLPYSRIQYDAYAQLKGFTLPRRITIFGAEQQSKIALQVGSLELNPELDTLTINLPDDIRIYNR